MTTLATSIDFDRTGRYLVVGDDEGAVHLFGVDNDGTQLDAARFVLPGGFLRSTRSM